MSRHKKKNQETDEQWVVDWQAGRSPERAAQKIFDRYGLPVATFFKNRGFDNETCQDLTQETFLRVYRHMRKYESKASLKTWIYKIARNVWKNSLRDGQAGKRVGQELPIQAMGGDEGEVLSEVERGLAQGQESRGPMSVVLAEERHRILRDAVSELPPDQQRCVILRIDQDLKDREIADLMNIPIGTVKSRLAKARKSLQDKLSKHYSDIDFSDDP